MFLPQHLFTVLATVHDAAWQDLLDRSDFWRAPGAHVDEEHRDLAFHILWHEGELARRLKPGAAEPGFDAVPIPPAFFDLPGCAALVQEWADMHAGNYGAGLATKMGLYAIRSGGTLGFHVDGPVFLKGMRADLADAQLQRGILETQASHRTILPLRFNTDDGFMICGARVPLARGKLFEFSNVLPHAYFNRGEEHAVLLVTTYLEEALLPEEFTYGPPTEAAGT